MTSILTTTALPVYAMPRSFTPPAVQVSRDFVYGKSMNLYSGEPVVYLPHSPQEVVYAAASLVVIHDLVQNTQVSTSCNLILEMLFLYVGG